MINKEVVPAFDMLLEELERIIPDLNDQAKALMDQKKYDQAQDLISKAKSVVAFQAKVQTLREEWVRMQVPATKASEPAPASNSLDRKQILPHTDLAKSKESSGIRIFDLHVPILRALVNRGGSLKFPDLIVVLRHYLEDTLNEYDQVVLPDGKTVRWINNVAWAKKPHIDLGYLSSTAPRDTWEITPSGRHALRAGLVELRVAALHPKKEIKDESGISYRAKKGERTHEDAFYMIILMALDELGGRAHCQKVFKKLEKMMTDQLTEKDWQTIPSDDKEIRWINTARWTRQRLVNDGLLASNSPRGIWEITPAGREALEVL